MPSAGDQPGWAPDPERPGMLRWWNGLGWSDARKAPDGSTAQAMAAQQQAVQASTVTPQQVARTTAARKATQVVPGAAAKAAGTLNPFATAATGLGVLAFGVGLWGVLPLVGLVLSIAGLVRARRLARDGQRRTGFGQSMVGLVLSVVGLIRWLPFLSELQPVIQDFLNS